MGEPGPAACATATDAGLWSAFLHTVVRIERPQGWLELRRGQPGLRVDVGSDITHVVTAWNPQGVRMRDLAENEVAQTHLIEELEALGLDWNRATGLAENEPWAEASVSVIGLSRTEAIELGRRWDQAAIFEWHPTDSVLKVIDCRGGNEAAAFEVAAEWLERRPCPMVPPRIRRTTRCRPPDGASQSAEWERNRRIMLSAVGCEVCCGAEGVDQTTTEEELGHG